MFSHVCIVTISLVLVGVSCEVSSGSHFHNSYQIQDDCQFQLCGLKFNSEFGLDTTPTAGSCSGDCDLLSINLATGKFQKEFLWPNCARICQNKFPFSEFSEYKPRFMCMETCYNSYNKIAPHHDLARYCLQVSCPVSSEDKMSQLECFEQCSSHAVTSVPEESWPLWARSLAGPCQSPPSHPNPAPNHKLTCADNHLWPAIQQSIATTPQIAETCLNVICDNNIKCGKECLKHIQKVEHLHREVWTGCSKSVNCSSVTSPSQRLRCSDNCLEEHRKEQLKQEEERYRQEQMDQQARALASSGAQAVLGGALAVAINTIFVFILNL